MEMRLGKRNEKELGVKFPYHVEWWNRMVRFPQSRWVPSDKIWIIPYTLQHIDRFIDMFKDVNIQIAPDLQQECYLLSYSLSKPTVKENKLELEKTSWGSYVESKLMFELKLRGYSLKTIKAYCGHVERFYRYYELHREIPTLDLISSFSHQLLDNQLSHSYVNQAISAIKFYLEKVCGMLEANFPYVRPKKEHKLPNVLAPSEVIRLLSVLKNHKHRALFYLIYSSGLRVGEVVRLRLADIDRERKTIHIRQGKGRKDRLTVISDAALEVITQYQLNYKLSSWLFPGQQPERHLTERTVQKVFE